MEVSVVSAKSALGFQGTLSGVSLSNYLALWSAESLRFITMSGVVAAAYPTGRFGGPIESVAQGVIVSSQTLAIVVGQNAQMHLVGVARIFVSQGVALPEVPRSIQVLDDSTVVAVGKQLVLIKRNKLRLEVDVVIPVRHEIVSTAAVQGVLFVATSAGIEVFRGGRTVSSLPLESLCDISAHVSTGGEIRCAALLKTGWVVDAFLQEGILKVANKIEQAVSSTATLKSICSAPRGVVVASFSPSSMKTHLERFFWFNSGLHRLDELALHGAKFVDAQGLTLIVQTRHEIRRVEISFGSCDKMTTSERLAKSVIDEPAESLPTVREQVEHIVDQLSETVAAVTSKLQGGGLRGTDEIDLHLKHVVELRAVAFAMKVREGDITDGIVTSTCASSALMSKLHTVFLRLRSLRLLVLGGFEPAWAGHLRAIDNSQRSRSAAFAQLFRQRLGLDAQTVVMDSIFLRPAELCMRTLLSFLGIEGDPTVSDLFGFLEQPNASIMVAIALLYLAPRAPHEEVLVFLDALRLPLGLVDWSRLLYAADLFPGEPGPLVPTTPPCLPLPVGELLLASAVEHFVNGGSLHLAFDLGKVLLHASDARIPERLGVRLAFLALQHQAPHLILSLLYKRRATADMYLQLLVKALVRCAVETKEIEPILGNMLPQELAPLVVSELRALQQHRYLLSFLVSTHRYDAALAECDRLELQDAEDSQQALAIRTFIRSLMRRGAAEGKPEFPITAHSALLETRH